MNTTELDRNIDRVTRRQDEYPRPGRATLTEWRAVLAGLRQSGLAPVVQFDRPHGQSGGPMVGVLTGIDDQYSEDDHAWMSLAWVSCGWTLYAVEIERIHVPAVAQPTVALFRGRADAVGGAA